MILGKRLAFIENTAGKCNVLADIGTDHGLLPVFSVLSGHCNRAIASDIVEGPCKRARKQVADYGVGDKVDVRHGPGMTVLSPGECDVCVIAGMGGNLIAEILEESYETAKTVKKFVLSPNSCEDDLRKYLYFHSFEITDESAVCEGRHEYLVMTCRYNEKCTADSEIDMPEWRFKLGFYLENKTDDSDVRTYLERVKRKLRIRMNGLLNAEIFEEAEYEILRKTAEETEKILKK